MQAAQAYDEFSATNIIIIDLPAFTPDASIDNNLFGVPEKCDNKFVENKITCSLLEPLEHKAIDILTYRKGRVKTYPALSSMAMEYLAIPGTS